MKLRIALLQMHVEMGNPKVNFAHARDMMEKAMEKKPDILVLPETWNTGFADAVVEMDPHWMNRFPAELEKNGASADAAGAALARAWIAAI